MRVLTRGHQQQQQQQQQAESVSASRPQTDVQNSRFLSLPARRVLAAGTSHLDNRTCIMTYIFINPCKRFIIFLTGKPHQAASFKVILFARGMFSGVMVLLVWRYESVHGTRHLNTRTFKH